MRRIGSDPRRCGWAAHGFTLVELVVSVTLLSLLAMAAVPMLRMPLTAYFESSARADLGSQLDLVQSRMRADFARALPNSVRLRNVGGRRMLEFLEVRAQGRFRFGSSGVAQVCPQPCAAPGNNDAFEAGCLERCFVSLGPAEGDPPVVGNDYVLINPLGPGIANGDPYAGGAVPVAGGIKTRLTALAAVPNGSRLSMTPHTFPALPASRRYYVVAGPVSYECDPTTQRLLRHDGYPINQVQPIAFGAAQTAQLADFVAACTFNYTATGTRGGLVSMTLRLARPIAGGTAAESTELILTAAVLEP